jgi:hypothetical protein
MSALVESVPLRGRGRAVSDGVDQVDREASEDRG